MSLVLLGLSHETAPVAVRERYSVAQEKWVSVNEKLAQDPLLAESALISTCNRTELVAVAAQEDEGLERLYRFFHDTIGDGSAAVGQFYERRGPEAAGHVFRVASSLDSMVLGEAQILGQVKLAYRAAVEAHACGPVLHRLFERAFRTAKRVRTETGLGASPISVARVGVQLAEEIFETFEGKRILLIGAGEMAVSALHGFRDVGVREIVVVNRTLETAQQLARSLGGRAAPLSEMVAELAQADAAVASVGVERPLLGLDEVRPATLDRQGRPLLLIDLGIPRNVDPAVNELEDVYLYDLDDLDGIADRGREQRRDAVAPAEAIVFEERDRFEAWQVGLQAVPTIRELLARTQQVARTEVTRTLRSLPDASPEVKEALDHMADAIVAKLVHRPVEKLRAEAEDKSGPYYADAVREIFGLSEDTD